VGNFGQNVPSALGDFRSRVCPAHLAVNPGAVFHRERRLRGDLLSEKTVRRGGGNAPGRRVWVGKIPAVLKVRHDIANRGSAEGLLKPLGDGAGRDRFARLDIGAHQVRQNLTVTPFLESWIPHSSTHLPVLVTILEALSRDVNKALDRVLSCY